MKLVRREVEKPWGRTDLPGGGGRRIGEIWFEAPDGRALPLLVKHIFTSEKLSVQVHPDDAAARARGLAHGKSECWHILEADAGAVLGLGLEAALSAEGLRESALDGSIEALLGWREVHAGDFFSVPAGTVHAIGGGVSLIEVQQPVDVTYRLYDYGRDRELHLEEAVGVASRAAYSDALATHVEDGETRCLVDGPHFTMLHVAGASDALIQRERFAMPLRGSLSSGSERAARGECLFVAAGVAIKASAGASWLLAAAPK